MKVEKGDIWQALGEADLILVTTNAHVTDAGELVMGAGAAESAKRQFPALPLELGQLLKQSGRAGGRYGVLLAGKVRYGYRHEAKEGEVQLIGPDPRFQEGRVRTRVGGFQSKTDWRKPSTIGLIAYSCGMLLRKLHAFEKSQGRPPRCALTFPGIRNGQLNREDVLPVLEDLLPDNVVVFEL